MSKGHGALVWFCGLPGSGKTTLARGVVERLKSKYNVDVTLLSMDNIRAKIFPDPKYTDEERDAAYRAFVILGSTLSHAGVNVILDATAHKKAWRELARVECPWFVEVFVKCPLELCMERETNRLNQSQVRKKLYADALERLKSGKSFSGLGKVPGIDEPFEENPKAEIVVDSSKNTMDELVNELMTRLTAKSSVFFR